MSDFEDTLQRQFDFSWKANDGGAAGFVQFADRSRKAEFGDLDIDGQFHFFNCLHWFPIIFPFI